MNRVDVDTAYAGEIISLAGTEGGVTDTVCAVENNEAIDVPPITPPVISMTFSPNDSPIAGKHSCQMSYHSYGV
jgi:GTP-binding protein